jgi:hypothetical protein
LSGRGEDTGGLASAPLPYLAVFIQLILYLVIIDLIVVVIVIVIVVVIVVVVVIDILIDILIDLDLSDYFDLSGYFHGCEDPCCCRAISSSCDTRRITRSRSWPPLRRPSRNRELKTLSEVLGCGVLDVDHPARNGTRSGGAASGMATRAA